MYEPVDAPYVPACQLHVPVPSTQVTVALPFVTLIVVPVQSPVVHQFCDAPLSEYDDSVLVVLCANLPDPFDCPALPL
jgi:hypothetical protein